MAQQKILILGATGLLGTVLTNSLRAKSIHKVVTHSHTSVADLNSDLTNYEGVKHLLNDVNPDFCINLFALTDVNLCESDRKKAYSLNVTPVKNIVKVVLTNNLKMKLIQISTDHVYNKALAKENETKLINYYAESKYLADEFSQLIEATVLRTNFFGHSQSSKVSFSDWIIQSLENKKPLNGFTDVFFNPLHLSTLVSEIARVVDNFHSGIYNLGSNEGLSKYQFMIELARHKGFSNSEIGAIKYSNSSIGIPRPFDMRTDVSKYESIFKTKLPTLLKEIQKC